MVLPDTELGLGRIDPNSDQWKMAYQTINENAELTTAAVLADRGRLTALEGQVGAADVDKRAPRAYGDGRVHVGGARVQIPGTTRYSAFPVQTLLSDGRILMVWYEATDHIASRNGIVVGAYSSDNGRTWGAKQTFVSLPGLDLRDPTVSTSDDGSVLFLTYIRCTAAKPRDGFFVRRSTDNGATWGPDVRIDPVDSNGAGTAPIVELANGSFLAVWFGTLTGESTDSCWRAYSVDGGVTWGAPERFLNGHADSKYYGEPYASVHGDNVVIMYRIGEVESLGITRSTNSGATWSAPALALTAATGRPSNTITSNGCLVVVYRDNPGGTVAFMHAVMRWSYDLGVTWSRAKLVEKADPSWMLYSCPTEISPGVILCSTAVEHSSTSASVSARYLLEGGAVSPLGDVAPDPAERADRGLSGLAVADSFDRPSGTSADVVWSDNGQKWTNPTPGPRIADGALEWSGSTGPYISYIRTMSPHMEVEAEMSWATGAGLYLVTRYNSASDYLMAGLEASGTVIRLYKVVAGVTTQLGTASLSAPAGFFYKLKVVSVGDVHRVYFEDDLVIAVTDAAHNTREYAGVRLGVSGGAATHRVRNFVVRRRAGLGA